MMVYRQYHEGIAYDKREPFTLEYNRARVHGLVLFTDTDPRMQPPDWDRLEHYRVGVVIDRHGLYTFKMWLKDEGKSVLFNNNAKERIGLNDERLVNIQSMTGPQDAVFEFVICGLINHYRGL